MNISRKLVLATGLLLSAGTSFNSFAYIGASDLKPEIKTILNFMDDLRQEDTQDATKLVKLLEVEFNDDVKEDASYKWSHVVIDNVDIINIARII